MRRVVVPRAIGGPALGPSVLARPAAATVLPLDGRTMGTSWRVLALADGRDRERLRVAVETTLASLVDALSNWEPGSALSRLNVAPLDRWIPAPRALLDVLMLARDVHRTSDGAFDPTVGDRVATWGFGPPRTRDRDAAIGFDAVGIDATGGRVRRRADVVVDLCGIAKGYAVDRVADVLTAAGAPHHLVEIGGELRGDGVKRDASPWWVAIERPHDLGRSELDAEMVDEYVVALHGLSVATSGDYRRFVERDGERRAHTIDPRTGDPVRGGPASATVLHPSCAAADAHATALMVMPADAGVAYAERCGLAAVLVGRGDAGATSRTRTTSSFDAMLE